MLILKYIEKFCILICLVYFLRVSYEFLALMAFIILLYCYHIFTWVTIDNGKNTTRTISRYTFHGVAFVTNERSISLTVMIPSSNSWSGLTRFPKIRLRDRPHYTGLVLCLVFLIISFDWYKQTSELICVPCACFSEDKWSEISKAVCPWVK